MEKERETFGEFMRRREAVSTEYINGQKAYCVCLRLMIRRHSFLPAATEVGAPVRSTLQTRKVPKRSAKVAPAISRFCIPHRAAISGFGLASNTPK